MIVRIETSRYGMHQMSPLGKNCLFSFFIMAFFNEPSSLLGKQFALVNLHLGFVFFFFFFLSIRIEIVVKVEWQHLRFGRIGYALNKNRLTTLVRKLKY
jgi:hypothetical protein